MLDLYHPNAAKLHLLHDNFLSIVANPNQFIFIKNSLSHYSYANRSFIELMGLHSLKNILNKTDHDLCRDTKKVKTYIEHDEETLESENTLILNDEVMPKKNELIKKQMSGKLYPLFTDESSRPIAVMGVVKPVHLPLKLTLEIAVLMTKEEMDCNFIRRSYKVTVFNKKISLSKRELQCIIELIKGKNAKEIAETFQLKQTTIEFYLENIKDKLGATSKSSLIMTVFNQHIIQQIIL